MESPGAVGTAGGRAGLGAHVVDDALTQRLYGFGRPA